MLDTEDVRGCWQSQREEHVWPRCSVGAVGFFACCRDVPRECVCLCVCIRIRVNVCACRCILKYAESCDTAKPNILA